MVPQDPVPDPGATERDALRAELRDSLGVIDGRAHEIRQQVLQADGLLDLERDQLLDGVLALLTEAKRMGDRLEDLIASDEPQVGTRAQPPTTTADPKR